MALSHVAIVRKLLLKGGYRINLQETLITSLPEGLHVGGSLKPRVKPLPDFLEFLCGPTLSLKNTSITTLPKGLKVVGDLDLTGTHVREIPPDAEISGKVIGRSRGMAERFANRSGEVGRSC